MKEDKRFSAIMCVISIVMLLPMSTAACKRGFSLMIRIKSKNELKLSNSLLTVLSIHSVEKAVTHFNQSHLDRKKPGIQQEQLEISQHSLIKYVDTRWNSTFDMITRLCEQQAAVASVLLSK